MDIHLGTVSLERVPAGLAFSTNLVKDTSEVTKRGSLYFCRFCNLYSCGMPAAPMLTKKGRKSVHGMCETSYIP